jgi:hypothetical protein
MNAPRFPTAAVVLGMHRSGTSALTGLLVHLGFAAPRSTLPASAANELGFWESEKVNAFNDQIFAELGISWHDLHEIPSGRLNDRRFQTFRRKAKDVLVGEFDQGVNPVIKDPRLCRLLPLWQPALAELAGRTVYAISLRDPVEVAASLARRNEFELELGLMLWARYYLDAESQTRGRQRAVVRYERLIDDWQQSVGVMRQQLDLPVTEFADEAHVTNFLSEELRHHRSSEEETLAAIKRIPLLKETYDILSAWADGNQIAPSDYGRLDRARRQIEKMNPLLADMFERNRLERKRRVSAQSRAEEAAAEVNFARRSRADFKELRGGLEKQAEELGRRFKKLIGEANERTTRLETEIRALTAQAGERAVLEKALKGAVERCAEAEFKVSQLEQACDEARLQARQQLAEVRIRGDAIDRLQDEISALREKQKTVTRKYRAAQEILERERKQLRESRAALAKAEAIVGRYRRSIPWKVYVRIAAALQRLKSLANRMVGNPAKARHERALILLDQSLLFDSDWYLENYPDVARSGGDPAEHYLKFGWLEGRDPGPGFSTTAYLKANADVAALGVNPLLHYVEYGHSEGRRAPEHASPSPARAAALEGFAPAAECLSFPVAGRGGARWFRAGQLAKDTGRVCAVGGIVLGYFPDEQVQQSFDHAIGRLSILAGRPDSEGFPGGDRICASIVDIWHTGQGVLRTRWNVDSAGPFVVRILQASSEGITVVGESLIESDLDLADARLVSPLLPLLFLFTKPEGNILGWQMLAFPSLARGGLHYGEFVALGGSASNATGPLDILAVSTTLADQLLKLRGSKTAPLVSAIEVDLNGADGAGPLFQAEFRAWLSTVMWVPLSARGDRIDGGAEFLARAASNDPVRLRKSDGVSLLLACDMYPSICALVAPFRRSAGDSVSAISFLVLGREPSQPATLLKAQPGVLQTPIEFRPAFPRIDAVKTSLPKLSEVALVALRAPLARALTDSELLVPVASPQLPIEESDIGVTWLIWPGAWDERDLVEALEAIGAQEAAGAASIAFIGTEPPGARRVAANLFSDRVRSFTNKEQAIDSVDTALVGYAGVGVIMHDVRTTALLAQALRDPDIATAAPVLVSVDKRGKSWLVSLADAGLAAYGAGSDIGVAGSPAAAELWRSSWPVLAPPRDLWLARASTVNSWISNGSVGGQHLCLALVSASYRRPGRDMAPPFAAPRAVRETSLSVEFVVG